MRIWKLFIFCIYFFAMNNYVIGQNIEDSFDPIEENLPIKECSQIIISKDLFKEFNCRKSFYNNKKINYQKIAINNTYNMNFKRFIDYFNEKKSKFDLIKYFKHKCIYIVYTYNKLAPDDTCLLIWDGLFYGDTVKLVSYVNVYSGNFEEEIDAVLFTKIVQYDLSKVLICNKTKVIIIKQMDGILLTINVE